MSTTLPPAAPGPTAFELLRARLAETSRIQAWWSNKFAPVLGTFYATVCLVGGPVVALLPRLLLLLLALVVGATYVSVLNDWTDLADDLAAGKRNHFAGRSAAFPALVLGSCLAAGLGLGLWLWHASPLCAGLYLGSWVAFSAYSLAPVRLKQRGLAGVLADASGSHFFPQLLAVATAGAWTGHAVPGYWLAAVGTWALGCGVRNILYHQLEDVAADAAAGVSTWVTQRGPGFTQRVGQWVAFPAEVLGLGALLLLSGQRWPGLLLLAYLALEGVKWRLWGQPARVLEPHARLLLNEYYEVFYPLGFLLVLMARQPAALLALGVQVLLFARCFWQVGHFGGVVAWQLAQKGLRRLGLA